MLKLTLSALAAASTLALSVPAFAQVHVHGSDRGVGVYVSPGHPGYRAHARSGCREITSRTVRPNGTVVIKRRTVCR